jgi:hypothetical protein
MRPTANRKTCFWNQNEAEAMNYLLQTETHSPRPKPALNQPRLNLDVRKRGFDPFYSGIVVGAMATVVGLLLGWFLLPI